ncbi:unnamed protein product, partial [Didymodactylos carnosus]
MTGRRMYPVTPVEFENESTALCGQKVVSPYTCGAVDYKGKYGFGDIVVEDPVTKRRTRVVSVICEEKRVTK